MAVRRPMAAGLMPSISFELPYDPAGRIFRPAFFGRMPIVRRDQSHRPATCVCAWDPNLAVTAAALPHPPKAFRTTANYATPPSATLPHWSIPARLPVVPKPPSPKPLPGPPIGRARGDHVPPGHASDAGGRLSRPSRRRQAHAPSSKPPEQRRDDFKEDHTGSLMSRRYCSSCRMARRTAVRWSP